MRKFKQVLLRRDAQESIAKKGYQWKFITERAPWQGGMYERFVRSIKTPMKKILGKSMLTYEELNTILTEIESQINSRPITTVSENPNDYEPLTPMHFLSGVKADTDFLDHKDFGQPLNYIRKRWMLQQRLSRQLWLRWKKEYLLGLQERTKWQLKKKNLKVDDVVLLEEDNTPRSQWKLARITEIIEGRDGLTRSVMLRLANGQQLKRPVQRLYLIEGKG